MHTYDKQRERERGEGYDMNIIPFMFKECLCKNKWFSDEININLIDFVIL